MILTNCEKLEKLLPYTSERAFVVVAENPETVEVPDGVSAMIIPSCITHFPCEKLTKVKEIIITPGGKEVLALCALGLFSIGIPISFVTDNYVKYESVYNVVDLEELWPKFGAHMLELLAKKYEDVYINCRYDEQIMIKEYEALSNYVKEVNKAYEKVTGLVNEYTKKKINELTQ
ncbi:MAG TPA: hypothetical protein PLI35_04740 [Acetomicrobium sp.]|nr:hypothetical protein [Acetomicrobium sp.]